MQSSHLRKPPVFRIIIVQAIVTLLLTAGFIAMNRTAGVSAFLGGLICLIPNAYLVYRAFSHSGARAAKNIVKDFYKGEAGKFLLTCCGFTLVFILVRPLDAMALFSTFVLVQAVSWFAPLLLR